MSFEHKCRYCDFSCNGKSHSTPLVMKLHLSEWHLEEVKADIKHFNGVRDKRHMEPYTGELLDVIRLSEQVKK